MSPKKTLVAHVRLTHLIIALVSALFVGLALTTSASAAPAVSAHQGGCSTYGSHGYSVGVCVDDRGTTTMAFPDIYVNSSPGTASCGINLSVWDDHGHRFSSRELPCAKGHYNGIGTGPFTGRTNVHAFARLDLRGTGYALGDSRSIRLGTVGRVLYNGDFPVATIVTRVKARPATAFAELHHCFNCSFPVPGAPTAYPADNQFLPLRPCVFGPVGCVGAPVRAFTDESVGDLRLVAQQGHFDGYGSVVRFHFANDRQGYLHIQVLGFVVHPSIDDNVNRQFAFQSWRQFAANLGTNLIKRCGGVICH